MDQNMDTPNPTGENRPPHPPEQPPQPSAPPEYDASAPPIPQQPAPQAETPLPANVEISQDAKQWGMFCHLAGLVGYIPVVPLIGSIIGPLILWLIKKDEMPFVDDQGKEALNFQITIAIGMIVSIALCLIFIGFFLLPALGIFNLVMIIIASIEANKGKAYRYPVCIRFVK